jgi:hypothetical protein
MYSGMSEEALHKGILDQIKQALGSISFELEQLPFFWKGGEPPTHDRRTSVKCSWKEGIVAEEDIRRTLLSEGT